MHLTSSDGLPLARIGQGTWDIPESGARRDEAIRALQVGVELGLTHIDTAEMYGNGRVEEIVGEAITPFHRDRIFLTSKVLPSNASYDGTRAACERTLKRLKTTYLDLYLLHWPSNIPFSQTARALRELREQGLVRAVGVSNFDILELRDACDQLDGIACNQVLYHLCERGPEHRLLPFCRENGIALIGYTPFGRGAYRRGRTEVLAEIAQMHGVSTEHVVLAFLTRDPQCYAIPKAARVLHVRENAAARQLRLRDDEWQRISEAYPRGSDGPLATL